MPDFRRVAIVGVGLIGGSIGKALREGGIASEVVGVVRRQASGEAALACGAVDVATTNFVEGVQGSDLVIAATPVDRIVETLRSAAFIEPRALLTDVGSTKAQICREVMTPDAPDACQARPSLNHFVGSHPLAGDHRTGPAAARSDLLHGKVVVVTPEDETPPGLVERIAEFWQSLGAEVELLDPEEHDNALAATSHLPHLIASALAGATPETWLRLAATGWGDTTRIAASSPELWAQIFQQNCDSLRDALRRFEHVLGSLEAALVSGDQARLLHLLQEAKRRRDALGD
ncbi:MAG: prephenate dehydrogenase/arogenate dehydrogenase family protein [Planctomycetales bacterium]|nr:prephenate dehydrogenase/arogenate dehydrogenase family protein [Planctomycetales bacterium]